MLLVKVVGKTCSAYAQRADHRVKRSDGPYRLGLENVAMEQA